MVEGNKRVEHIPADWVEAVRRRVTAGRRFKQAAGKLLTINAELLVLARKQRRRRRRHCGQPPP